MAAPSIAVADIIQCTIQNRANDQLGLMILHFRCIGVAGLSATVQDAANAFDSSLAASVKAMMSAQATYERCNARRVFPTPPSLEFTSNVGTGPGGDAFDLLPRQAAGIITKKTDFSGRKNRGRIYVPFLSEKSCGPDGLVNAGGLTVMGTFAAALSGTIVAGGGGNTASLILVVYQRHNPAASQPVSSTIVRDKFGTQKRRGSYGRTN